MSVRWMDYIIRERRDLRGTELTCAIIIANYVSADDACYPGIKRIAGDLRSSVRQTQAVIRRLEQKGVFKIVSGDGRGNKTLFVFQKDDENSTLLEQKKDDGNNTLLEQKGRSFAQRKGEVLRKERVKFCALPLNKDEPFKEPCIKSCMSNDTEISDTPGELTVELDEEDVEVKKPRLKNKSSLRSKPRDPRIDHPAIKLIKGLMRRWPDKLLWDRIISRFGSEFDRELLTACRVAWIERGYNPNATTWLNWYFDGIPERKYNGQQREHGTSKKQPKPSNQPIDALILGGAEIIG